jgi:hypothetical protein
MSDEEKPDSLPSPPPAPYNPHQWMQDTLRTSPEQPKASDSALPSPPVQAQPMAPPQLQPPPVPHVVRHYAPQAGSSSSHGEEMATGGMTTGIIAACLMAVGLIPCLGWLNWFTLALSAIAFVLCIVALLGEKNPAVQRKAVTGLVLASVAAFLGGIRLILGFGCL